MGIIIKRKDPLVEVGLTPEPKKVGIPKPTAPTPAMKGGIRKPTEGPAPVIQAKPIPTPQVVTKAVYVAPVVKEKLSPDQLAVGTRVRLTHQWDAAYKVCKTGDTGTVAKFNAAQNPEESPGKDLYKIALDAPRVHHTTWLYRDQFEVVSC